MNGNKTISPIVILTLVLLVLVAIPYLLAWLLKPAGAVFPGFLVNPLDGFSYLAKMEQGRAGSWLFQLPYAADPGEPALLFTFYILLGHLARWLPGNSIIIFHGVRLLAAVAMALAADRLFKVLLGEGAAANWSSVIFMFGSGLGWLAAPFGGMTSDLLIPESIPLFAASLNPHFPLSYAAMALVVVLVLRPERTNRNSLLIASLGFVLGAVQPFAAVTLLVVLGGWQIWELALADGGFGSWRRQPRLISILALAVGAGPWLIYDLWLTRSHPVLQAWNLQNQTPSPAPPAYLLGFGIPLALSLLGLLKADYDNPEKARLLIAWLAANALLLYAPFNLQRRFSLGLFLPIAAAAGLGLRWLTTNFSSRRWLPYVLVLLALPSNLIALAAGVGLVVEGSPLLLLTANEQAGYQWISENVEGRPLILAAPRTGNRLPAYADIRVLYGHPFETPNAEHQRQRAVELLAAVAEDGEVVSARLNELGIGYVVLGPHERSLLGRPIDVPDWPLAFSQGDFMLLAVPQP